MPRNEGARVRAVLAAARTIQNLDPSALADCRRMDAQTGAPAFWRLAAQHPDSIGHRDQTRRWMEIVRIIAILIPKGVPESRSALHDETRRLGEALCDGGDPTWAGPSPVFSERRLAQLMAARGPLRGALLRRAARMLAHSRNPHSGVNVVDIAMTLLQPTDGRRLAEPYYRRLDRAEQAAQHSEEGVN